MFSTREISVKVSTFVTLIYYFFNVNHKNRYIFTYNKKNKLL